MNIKNKLFPYPVLNNDVYLSNYKSSHFELEYNDRFDNENFILDNIHVTLDNEDLKKLIKNNEIKCYCIVECPQSMYRQTFEISTEPRTVKIPLFDLIGKLEVSAFLCANVDINNYFSSDFEDLYDDVKFDIEKHSIVGVDNGMKQRIDYEDRDDDKKGSIFVIITDLDATSRTTKWTYDENLIKITVPKLQHSEYESIKSVPNYKNIFLSMFAVTPLSFILSSFVKEKVPISELEFHFKWFKAFNDTYEKMNNKRLTDEEFLEYDNVQIYSLIQELFNYCVTNSVDDLFKICNEGVGELNED